MTRIPFGRRKITTLVGVTLVGALALSGCSSDSGGGKVAADAPKHLSGTVSLWHFFTGREAGVIQTAVTSFEKKYPDVKVDVHGGQDDDKLQKVISSGGNIDVGLSYSTAIVGSFCSSGAFRDLSPYIKRDKVDLTDIPKAIRAYTEYNGTRCTMPVLSDTSALMYNTEAFAKAGITAPPKTLDELEADGLKMTTYNPDGSIKTLGFNPLIDFYENSVEHWAPMINGSFLKDNKSVIGKEEGWKKLLAWQKAYVDKIGYSKLKAFTSGLGQEFAADNAFQTGQVSMEIDGEYRTAFIESQKPGLKYATAPTPVMTGHEDMYGTTFIAGNVAGIAKGSKNPELAWALLKYLSTDTAAQVQMANGLKNVPTITSALESKDLEVSEQYKPFITGAQNPKTITAPATADGAAYLKTFAQFWQNYQAGNGQGLDAGLKKVDSDIDNALGLVSGP
jgi:multiple sugar transport system substrate-binding protein